MVIICSVNGDHATRAADPTSRAPILDVAGLSVDIGGRRLVDDVHLQLLPGQRLGLIGESGSGKSLTGLSLLGLLPPKARTSGSVLLRDQEVSQLPESAWRRLRGAGIAMVFQDAVSSLNPLVRVQRQVSEPLRQHRGMAGPRARAQARALLRRVGFPAPERVARCTPAQLSGGQRQRVALAMALACRPAVLVADEPTTALDVTVQAEILQLLAEVTGGDDGPALLLISHDLPVIAQLCPTVMVMCAGAVVDRGVLTEMLRDPQHPRTAALVDSARQLESAQDRALPEEAS